MELCGRTLLLVCTFLPIRNVGLYGIRVAMWSEFKGHLCTEQLKCIVIIIDAMGSFRPHNSYHEGPGAASGLDLTPSSLAGPLAD